MKGTESKISKTSCETVVIVKETSKLREGRPLKATAISGRPHRGDGDAGLTCEGHCGDVQGQGSQAEEAQVQRS